MKKKLSTIPFIALIVISILGVIFPGIPEHIVTEGLNAADIAWMLTATALVMIMTPGLALFYGGMVNSKNIISTMLQSFISMGIVSILWVTVGFSIAFGPSVYGLFGNAFTHIMYRGVLESKPFVTATTIPLVLYSLFQLKFAIITPALITGSFSERIKFTSYILFISLWTLMIYCPLAHWVWHPDGFLAKLGVLDFAGGTVVHMSAGCAALAAALYLGKKKTNDNEPHTPANIPFVILGTSLLWFGWFGFNAGSAVSSGAVAAMAFATTNVAGAAAGLAWLFFDSIRGKKPSAMGFCIGAVVGLVAITPAAGFVSIANSLFIGTFASITSNMVVNWRAKSSLDDTLDVFPCHGVGGIVGMLMTGIFANKKINPAGNDGLYYGGVSLFLHHLIAMVVVIGFVFFGTMILLKVTDLISPLRVDAQEQKIGLDITQHGEKI